MKFLVLSLMVLVLGGSQSYSGPEIDKSKVIVIDGVIAQGNILPLGKELLDRANRGESEVQMIINSPGGEVVTGFLFLNLMEAAKAKGLKITCFVPTIAASMAYQILLHCDERHSLNKSFLLWHRARVMMGGLFGKPMTAPELSVLAHSLNQTDEGIFQELLKFMPEITEETIRYHFEVETLHTGLDLHMLSPEFITTHTAISGLFEALLSKDVVRNESLDMGAINVDEIIYIRESLINTTAH